MREELALPVLKAKARALGDANYGNRPPVASVSTLAQPYNPLYSLIQEKDIGNSLVQVSNGQTKTVASQI